MQPNTVTTHQQTDPPDRAAVPAELLETVARALAAALIPLPRAPAPPGAEEQADFLTAAQLARRLGVWLRLAAPVPAVQTRRILPGPWGGE